MICSAPERTAPCRAPSPVLSASVGVPATGITVYGCGPDEATLLGATAHRLGVRLTVTEAALSEANARLALGNRCVSVGHKSPVTNPTLLALSRAGVEYLSSRSIGLDHIDVEYAASVGITVGNVTYSPDSVADYTLMLMLMAVRHAATVVRRADARDYRLGERRGRELRDLTVGVVGTGRIGTAVVRRLEAFGCRVVASDPRRSAPADYVSLDELVRVSDVVTLHVPLDPGTHHLLDRRRIEQMKHGAVVVNTARGPVVDTEALVGALESGRLGGAALDVVEGEDGIFYNDCRSTPLASDLLARLARLPHVIVTPHTAYYTDRALRDAVENSLANCLAFESARRS